MCFSSDGALDEAGDAVALALGDQRADLVLGVVGLVVLDRRDRRRQVGDELVVDLLAGIDAAGGGAVLAGIVVAEGAQAVDHRVDIGVVEDDDRRLAAELQMRALDRLGGRLQHLLAGGDVAGDRDHVDLGMVDQRVADALAAPEHDIDDALGQDLGEHLGELQRGQRRLLGRLEHHRVAAGDAPAPASTPSSSADSSTARSRRRCRSDRAGPSRCGPADIRRRPAPGMRAHRAGEEAVAVDDRRDLVVAAPR